MAAPPQPQSGVRNCPRCGSVLPRVANSELAQVCCDACGARFKIERTAKPAEFRPRLDAEWLDLATQENLFTPPPEYVPPPAPDNRPPTREMLTAEVDEPTTRWPLLSGVWGFPWYPTTLSAWIGCTMGLICGGGLLAASIGFTIWVFSSGLFLAAVSLIALIVATALMIVISLGYVTQAFLTTLEMTGNGHDVIEEWGSSDFRDWPVTLIPVASAGSYTGGIAYFLYAASDDPWLAGAVGTIVFPVILLSMLERDSWLIPLSEPITRTLRLVGWAWLVVWAESLALVGVLATAFLWLYHRSIVYPVVLAPLIAAGILIYARLLGRLGWLGSRAVARENERRSLAS